MTQRDKDHGEFRQATLCVEPIKQRLWVKPLVLCMFSIGGTFIAMLADNAGLSGTLPDITLKSVESLLSIMASSMLVIATFSVRTVALFSAL